MRKRPRYHGYAEAVADILGVTILNNFYNSSKIVFDTKFHTHTLGYPYFFCNTSVITRYLNKNAPFSRNRKLRFWNVCRIQIIVNSNINFNFPLNSVFIDVIVFNELCVEFSLVTFSPRVSDVVRYREHFSVMYFLPAHTLNTCLD